jgi:hypothetical protein
VASNALEWKGQPGHYEVYYLTLTDPATGVGFWIRYTMLAPLPGGGEEPTAALWFLAMDPRDGHQPTFGRKATFPIASMRSQADPFELVIDGATLTGERMTGAVADAEWDLHFRPSKLAYDHVHPLLRRAGVAQTVLTLPQADLTVSGTIAFGGERTQISGAHGGQAHLWGSKHARKWAWVHAGDFRDHDGAAAPGTVIDAVSVFVERFGRESGPNTPVVGRLEDEDFISTTPVRVIRTPSRFALTGWRFEAVAGRRKLIGQVDADRSRLAGVTYHDPDGELAYCYNSEVASMRVQILHRGRRPGGWLHQRTLTCDGRAHFEYAQRSPVPGLELLTS